MKKANVVLGVTAQLNDMVENMNKQGGAEAKAMLASKRRAMFKVALDWISDMTMLTAGGGLVMGVVELICTGAPFDHSFLGWISAVRL